jgi:hypothetical protein
MPAVSALPAITRGSRRRGRRSHRGPRQMLGSSPGSGGGVITTATLRDATHWDDLVADSGWPGSSGTGCGTRH